MGLARGRGRGKGRGGVVKPKSRGIAVKPPPLLGRPAPAPPMALRPRGLPVPPLLPRMRPPPPGLRPSRGMPTAPLPMLGPGRPIHPPFHPIPPPHVSPLMPLRPPMPPPSLIRSRGPLPMHSGTYPAPMSSRGKFGGKRGGVRVNIPKGGKLKGKGKKNEFEGTCSKDGSHYCETCDRSFRSEETLTEHLSQHQTCGLEGCQFTAHAAVVMRHVEMQHATGLYSKISAITDKPEDIAKWISERKKRYPTKENIEKQKKEREEKMKRGERLEDQKTRFNPDFSVRRGRRNESRGSLHMRGKRSASRADNTINTKPAKMNRAPRKTRQQISTTYHSDEEENRNCRGKLPAFLGTVAFSHENEEPENEKEEKKFSDDEWDANQENKAETKDFTGPIVTVSTALSNIMGMYASGASDSEGEESHSNVKGVENNAKKTNTETAVAISAESKSKSPASNKVCKPSVSNDSEGSGPEEVPVVKALETTQPTENQSESEEQQQPPVRSTGRKRKRFHRQRVSKRKFEGKGENGQSAEKTGQPQAPQRKIHLHRRRLTLLEKLLNSEIRHERNVILQCVRYVVNENFFDVPAEYTQDEEKQMIYDRILGKLETVRQCNHYVVEKNFFGVPCSEGIKCDEDKDD
ncbi:nuclear fragile X mental retardation-interacting protein 1 [Schistocerca piceifrons]|uniref:nuclear fragile X mental retardation-interacting protein 1 n=1 Tax=Schistocerca piceifrons TaxID=274613 RepID=UPI001F5FA60C|nr:nuclear fragile X mental retardation-interacting protein 1 [Schistocerca piceifrons]